MADGKPGRKLKHIDWAVVEDNLKYCCTQREIAGVLGVSEPTLRDKCMESHGMPWDEYVKPFYGYAASRLRRAQCEKALDGNPALLIWLGKQWLNQYDRQAVAVQQNVDIDIKGLTDEQLKMLQSDPSAIGRMVAHKSDVSGEDNESSNGNSNANEGRVIDNFEPHENDEMVTYDDLVAKDCG